MESWTEKYRPKSLSDIVGNGKAVTTLKEWAEDWTNAPKKAVILAGRAGVGKTSAALALANDMGWVAVEMNASDARNANRIKEVAMRGATHGTFSGDGDYLDVNEGQRKLIIMDEADNLHEASGGMGDRGGKKAIIDTIRSTKQPIILIVNDLYELTKKTGSPLKTLALTIKFNRVPKTSLRKAVREIADIEGFTFDDGALETFSENAGGDMRSAVNDLETICRNLEPGSTIGPDDLDSIGYRDERRDVFEVLATVFKTTDPEKAMEAYNRLDETPDRFLLWVEENVPYKYTDPDDLARAFDAITEADLMLNRARATQDFSFWAYAIKLLTAGVAVAKKNEYHGYVKYRFPSFLTMRSRAQKGASKELLTIIGAHTHSSRSFVRNQLMEPFIELFQQDEEFAASMTGRLDLSRKDVEFLADTSDVDDIFARAEEIALARQRSYTGKGLFAFDGAPQGG
jgi:replication factor C large subunit